MKKTTFGAPRGFWQCEKKPGFVPLLYYSTFSGLGRKREENVSRLLYVCFHDLTYFAQHTTHFVKLCHHPPKIELKLN
jgi:hypothetical protein